MKQKTASSIKKGFSFVIISAVFALAAGPVRQSDARLAPKLLNYQGFLTDTLGNPVTNPLVSMTFAIFDAASAGNQKWTETQPAVTVDKGIFNVLLGSVAPIPDSVFTNSTDRWLELTVAGQVLSPRTRIVSAGYAYTATYSDTAQYARNGTPDNDWNFLITDGADTTLQSGGRWGLARRGNVLYGDADSTHVNLGVACTTGFNGQTMKYITIGGGTRNKAQFEYSTIGGGFRNDAYGFYAAIGGGCHNSADDWAVVSGGESNTANAEYAFIGGGQNNNAYEYATIGGGISNNAQGYNTTIGGGMSNASDGRFSTIGGGHDNQADDTCSTIGGGAFNIANCNGTVAGGRSNRAILNYASVCGGYDNNAEGPYAAIGGGSSNYAAHYFTAIGGGRQNAAIDSNATIGGGYSNFAGGMYSSIVGGYADTITAAGDYSYLFGVNSNLTQDSTFMVDMPHIRFGKETGGYEFPTTDGTNGQALITNGSGQLNWTAISGTDNDWTFLISDGADTTLQTGGRWGLARAGNVMYGNADSTHVNFGVNCTTGTSGQNHKYCTVVNGLNNSAGNDYGNIGGGRNNSNNGFCSTIGGGWCNTIEPTAIYATIAGGCHNTSNHVYATVGGGYMNTASDSSATVGGGLHNNAYEKMSTVSGGLSNIANGRISTIGGGIDNESSADTSFIGGGCGNMISSPARCGVIGGGSHNQIFDPYSAVLSGLWNTAGNFSQVGDFATVAGGTHNLAELSYSFIGGGQYNHATASAVVVGGENNYAANYSAFVGCGKDNSAYGSFSYIGGGEKNYTYFNSSHTVIGGGQYDSTFGNYSVVSGGCRNRTHHNYATIGGGHQNQADGEYSTISGGLINHTSQYGDAVGGGKDNTAGGGYTTVAGGEGNAVSGSYGTIGGGHSNTNLGYGATIGGGWYDSISSGVNYATIAGGCHNLASNDWTTVGGGYYNTAEGYIATVAGGYLDTAYAAYGAVLGGYSNLAGDTAMDTAAVVCAGYNNSALAKYAFIGGGYFNCNAGEYSVIAGGYADTIVATGDYSCLFGINSNLTQDSTFMIDLPHIRFGTEATGYEFPKSDGLANQTLTTNGSGLLTWNFGSNFSDNHWLFLVSDGGDTTLQMGGRWGIARAGNIMYGNADSTHVNLGVACTTGISGSNYKYCVISGGYSNTASGNRSTVAGGDNNTASNYAATVAGGNNNTASGNRSTVGGGYYNAASSAYTTVAGGRNNTTSGDYASVGGGYQNTASMNATVSGGYQNTAGSGDATVGGGYQNSAGAYSATIAGGYADTAAAYYSFATNYSAKVNAGDTNSAAFTTSHTIAKNQVRAAAFSTGTVDYAMDHPNDPMNKILNQYGVSSDEVQSQYSGSAVLDDNGRATVNLPDYFDDINRNPRIQLTGVGTYEVYIADDIVGNKFMIGGKPNTKVYWTVTAERTDIHAEIARIQTPVVQEKKGDLRGHSIDDDAMIGMYDGLRLKNPELFKFKTEEGRRVHEQSKMMVENNR